MYNCEMDRKITIHYFSKQIMDNVLFTKQQDGKHNTCIKMNEIVNFCTFRVLEFTPSKNYHL